MSHILAIDQGTTSSRAIIFDAGMRIVATAQEEFDQHFPQSGWVEHDPADLWSTTAGTCRAAIEKAGLAPQDIAAIGITNQRETTLVWDAKTGKPLYNAIVWQDRRTADFCRSLREDGLAQTLTDKTGLLADPYFSGTKLKWILDHVDGARARAENGEILFGTVDTWLIWKLTGGAVHCTDATNAARTILYDIHKGRWSTTICKMLDIPMAMLPQVRDCAADFGTTRPDLFGRPIPILGVAGDQQAATIGQACFAPGMLKSTYGTGCFALLNTGDSPVVSNNRLLTTIAYQLDGTPTYALEGSIFVAGAVVQWLRDGLKIIRDAKETQPLAEAADPHQNVVLVPAFTGLGAPYWNAECRGAVFGLTRNSGAPELARAALESVGFQTRDLLDAMRADWQTDKAQATLRVDGGMSASNWAMQFLADIIDAPVDRPQVLETTALGAAWLAGQRAGLYPDRDGFAKAWALEQTFTPRMDAETRARKYGDWTRAVQATLSFSTPFGFQTATRIAFGRGEAARAADEVARLGQSALLVRGTSVPWVDGFAERLRDKGCTVHSVTVQGEPTVATVEAAVAQARAAGVDCVVAIGGGSVIDLAKAAAALIPSARPLMDHLEGVGQGLPLEVAPLPLVALPTTAGTGAEVTKNAVIGVPESGRKVSLRDARMLPRLALVDPQLTDNAPRGVTLASGLDALTQVIEPYLSRRATLLTDALCVQAIPMGLAALMRLMQGEDAQARDQMAYVSLLGGMALANSGLGAVHGFAGVIGGRFDAPHGGVCGRLLCPVLQANRAAVTAAGGGVARYDQIDAWIGIALGVPADRAVSALSARLEDWGLPRLGDWMGPDADLAAVAEDAAGASSMQANIVPLDPAVLIGILEDAS